MTAGGCGPGSDRGQGTTGGHPRDQLPAHVRSRPVRRVQTPSDIRHLCALLGAGHWLAGILASAIRLRGSRLGRILVPSFRVTHVSSTGRASGSTRGSVPLHNQAGDRPHHLASSQASSGLCRAARGRALPGQRHQIAEPEGMRASAPTCSRPLLEQV